MKACIKLTRSGLCECVCIRNPLAMYFVVTGKVTSDMFKMLVLQVKSVTAHCIKNLFYTRTKLEQLQTCDLNSRLLMILLVEI